MASLNEVCSGGLSVWLRVFMSLYGSTFGGGCKFDALRTCVVGWQVCKGVLARKSAMLAAKYVRRDGVTSAPDLSMSARFSWMAVIVMKRCTCCRVLELGFPILESK